MSFPRTVETGPQLGEQGAALSLTARSLADPVQGGRKGVRAAGVEDRAPVTAHGRPVGFCCSPGRDASLDTAEKAKDGLLGPGNLTSDGELSEEAHGCTLPFVIKGRLAQAEIVILERANL